MSCYTSYYWFMNKVQRSIFFIVVAKESCSQLCSKDSKKTSLGHVFYESKKMWQVTIVKKNYGIHNVGIFKDYLLLNTSYFVILQELYDAFINTHGNDFLVRDCLGRWSLAYNWLIQLDVNLFGVVNSNLIFLDILLILYAFSYTRLFLSTQTPLMKILWQNLSIWTRLVNKLKLLCKIIDNPPSFKVHLFDCSSYKYFF